MKFRPLLETAPLFNEHREHTSLVSIDECSIDECACLFPADRQQQQPKPRKNTAAPQPPWSWSWQAVRDTNDESAHTPHTPPAFDITGESCHVPTFALTAECYNVGALDVKETLLISTKNFWTRACYQILTLCRPNVIRYASAPRGAHWHPKSPEVQLSFKVVVNLLKAIFLCYYCSFFCVQLDQMYLKKGLSKTTHLAWIRSTRVCALKDIYLWTSSYAALT